MAGRRRKSKKRFAASSPSTAEPPEHFEFFIDECVAMRQVAEVVRDAGHVAHVQGEATFGTGTPDVEWLPKIGERDWILITKDKNIRKREIELRALRQSGVRAFVITAGGLRGEEQARVIREAFPKMLRLLRRHRSSFIARITAESNVELIDVTKYVREDDSESAKTS
jgi:predicted nuclease of predicted toxin-antitoxin system